MKPRARLAVALFALAQVALPTAARAATPPHGALQLLTGRGACVGTGGGCARLRGPIGLDQIAVSPDGRNVYLVGQGGGIAMLARDRRSGRLRQLAGAAGCARSDGRQGCARLADLRGAQAVVVTPDGRSVYVTIAHGVLAFARAARTGQLRATGSISVRGIDSPTELVGGGSRTLYVAGTHTGSISGESGSLAVLKRDPGSGLLTQLAGTAGCLTNGGSNQCSSAECVHALAVLVPSRDGRYLYSGSTNSLDFEDTAPGSVATFARAVATGALTYLGCVTRRQAVSDMASDPYDNTLFVSTLFGNRGTGQASAAIDRYVPASGHVLARERQLVCISGAHCQVPLELGASTLAVDSHAHTMYVAVVFGGIGALRIHTGGRLASLIGRWGCVVARHHFMPPARCSRAGAEVGASVALAPNGRNLYVGTLGQASGNLYAGGVETFSVR